MHHPIICLVIVRVTILTWKQYKVILCDVSVQYFYNNVYEDHKL